MSKASNINVNLDVAKRLDVTCRKGDTFSLSMIVTDSEGVLVDFGAYTDIAMQVRSTDSDTGTPIIEFAYPADFDTTTVGTLIVIKDSTFMATVDSGVFVYDMQLTDATGKTVTWFYGLFKINDDVTF